MTEAKQEAGMWAIVDLMGHVRLSGWLTEETKYGAVLGRVDMPMPDGSTATRWFGGGSVYSISAVSEDVARAAARANPPPVSVYDMRALVQSVLPAPRKDDEPEFDDDESDGPY